jgi:hypothetical protein
MAEDQEPELSTQLNALISNAELDRLIERRRFAGAIDLYRRSKNRLLSSSPYGLGICNLTFTSSGPIPSCCRSLPVTLISHGPPR